MEEPLEHTYFNWLYAKVCDPRATSKERQFDTLLSILHQTEFVWTVSGDDNRAEDGRDLRDEFLTQSDIPVDTKWLNESCSVLEMLIAFSRKAGFETSDPAKFWFWEMLKNLGLDICNDAEDLDANIIHNIIHTFVLRDYDPIGHGGLFPLRETDHDQRFIEIWYQFSEYLYQNNIM